MQPKLLCTAQKIQFSKTQRPRNWRRRNRLMTCLEQNVAPKSGASTNLPGRIHLVPMMWTGLVRSVGPFPPRPSPENAVLNALILELSLSTGRRRRPACPCRKIKYERSDDAGRQGRASLRCCRGCELVASSAHPCSTTGGFGSDCSSSHNSAADGEGGALPRQSRGPNSPVGSNRSPARNIRSARVSGPRSADPGCPSPGYGS
jgi:hypothetical protein